MAKLFTGGDFIRFTYADTGYRGILPKLILQEKTVYRVDYSCKKNDQAGRFGLTCTTNPYSGIVTWNPHLM